MNDNSTNTDKDQNENADNLSQNDQIDEALANAMKGGEDEGGEAISETDKLQGEIAEHKDKYLRMMAEFDNFKRRTAKEKQELRENGGKDMVESLLVVLDDMDRAAKQLETTEDLTILKEGISLVFTKLRTIMQQKGLKLMDADKKDFNADLHEAITELPAPSEDMKGKVIAVVEPGYYLNDKLIRHAKVVVGN